MLIAIRSYRAQPFIGRSVKTPQIALPIFDPIQTPLKARQSQLKSSPPHSDHTSPLHTDAIPPSCTTTHPPRPIRTTMPARNVARATASLTTHLSRAQAHHASRFDYHLPSDRIASRPLGARDSARLLVVPGEGRVTHARFSELPQWMPGGAVMVRNVSRVIPARVAMTKRGSGGRAELMLLQPVGVGAPVAMASAVGGQVWQAFVGGRRVRVGDVLEAGVGGGVLEARVLRREAQAATVEFGGTGFGGEVLGEVLERVGVTPLPPYIKREVEEADRVAYQTVYAREEGSVAAPTAGLHVTEEVLGGLRARGVGVEDVVLHVGAGTFAQVEGDVGAHLMHEERVGVDVEVVERLLRQVERGRDIVALGTTSVRVLESLYWFGVRLLCDGPGQKEESFFVGQWEPYMRLDELGEANLPTAHEALKAALLWRGVHSVPFLGQTRLLIVPGYSFRLVSALITNFHQPRSTLLMLVSAFHGGHPEDVFRIYTEALHTGYRFLSYGDSSIYANSDFFQRTEGYHFTGQH